MLKRDRPVVITEKEKLGINEKVWLAGANLTMSPLGYVPHEINEICGSIPGCRNYIWLHARDHRHQRVRTLVMQPLLDEANALKETPRHYIFYSWLKHQQQRMAEWERASSINSAIPERADLSAQDREDAEH
eukprot:1961124-Prymnesium_polylepis.2